MYLPSGVSRCDFEAVLEKLQWPVNFSKSASYMSAGKTSNSRGDIEGILINRK